MFCSPPETSAELYPAAHRTDCSITCSIFLRPPPLPQSPVGMFNNSIPKKLPVLTKLFSRSASEAGRHQLKIDSVTRWMEIAMSKKKKKKKGPQQFYGRHLTKKKIQGLLRPTLVGNHPEPCTKFIIHLNIIKRTLSKEMHMQLFAKQKGLHGCF